jgi:putative DNA primase/helicase
MSGTKHREVFPAMLKQVGRVDFQLLAFGTEIIELRAKLKELKNSAYNPDGSFDTSPAGSIAVQEMGKLEDKLKKLKPTQKQIIVLGVDYLLNLCKANEWQLAAQHGRVYVYNGAYWQAVDENDMKQFLGQALEKMGVRFVDAKYFRFRDDLTKQFFTSAHLPAPERDRGTVCINLRNGTLSVGIDGSVQLREFRPEDFLRYQLGFDYDPAATAPKWQSYLNDVLPDAEVQRALAEAAALAFVPSSVLKLEKIPVLHGSGSNGKSVFQDTFRAVLGRENVSGHSLKLLTGNENARADLQDRLINISSEIGGIADSEVFKLLASGEPVSAKILYQDVHTMEDYGRLVCNANKLPAEVENSHAFFRRFLIIPFSVTVDPAKKDTNLSKKIIETELPGVLNWILEGLARLLKQNDFSPCRAADQALQQYRHESNTVSLWLEDASYTVSTSGHELPRGTMLNEYQAFCKAEGFKAVGGKVFSQRMQAAGFEKYRKSGGYFYPAIKGGQDAQPF